MKLKEQKILSLIQLACAEFQQLQQVLHDDLKLSWEFFFEVLLSLSA